MVALVDRFAAVFAREGVTTPAGARSGDRARRLGRAPALLAVIAALALAVAPSSGARILAPWGASLAATPTLDTANGASHATGGRPTRHAISPDPHDGADLAVWNTRLAVGSAVAPRGGQVRAVRIKGCALKDTSAPTQTSGGTHVNTINFQALTPQRDGSYRPDVTAAGFRLPFCSHSADPKEGAVNTSTVTTFQPVHMCISKGDTVGFYDIGGFIPNSSGLPWYSEGVPFEVIASVAGSSMSSFADADVSGGRYLPGARPRGTNSGFGSESHEQLMLQVVEGTGGDAYGLCPGGTANEPATSNRVLCAYHPPYDRHRHCGHARGDRLRRSAPEPMKVGTDERRKAR